MASPGSEELTADCTTLRTAGPDLCLYVVAVRLLLMSIFTPHGSWVLYMFGEGWMDGWMVGYIHGQMYVQYSGYDDAQKTCSALFEARA